MEEPILDPKFMRSLVEIYLPPIIETLLDRGELDRERLHDESYLTSVVANNLQMTEELYTSTLIYDEFVEAAKEAAADRPMVAMVLIGVALEDIVTSFYRLLLSSRMEEKQLGQLLRSPIQAKLTWILALATDDQLPEDLVATVLQVMELRNQIVHYKSVPGHIDDEGRGKSWASIHRELTRLGITRIIEIPAELLAAFELMLDRTNPDRQTIRNVIRARLDSVADGHNNI